MNMFCKTRYLIFTSAILYSLPLYCWWSVPSTSELKKIYKSLSCQHAPINLLFHIKSFIWWYDNSNTQAAEATYFLFSHLILLWLKLTPTSHPHGLFVFCELHGCSMLDSPWQKLWTSINIKKQFCHNDKQHEVDPNLAVTARLPDND